MHCRLKKTIAARTLACTLRGRQTCASNLSTYDDRSKRNWKAISLSLSLCMQYYECTFWPIDRSMHYAFVCLASCTTIYLSLFIFISTVSGSNYTCVCLVKLYICMQLVARLVTFSLEIVGKTESPQSLSPIMVQSRCRTLAYCMALLPATTLRNYYHLFCLVVWV